MTNVWSDRYANYLDMTIYFEMYNVLKSHTVLRKYAQSLSVNLKKCATAFPPHPTSCWWHIQPGSLSIHSGSFFLSLGGNFLKKQMSETPSEIQACMPDCFNATNYGQWMRFLIDVNTLKHQWLRPQNECDGLAPFLPRPRSCRLPAAGSIQAPQRGDSWMLGQSQVPRHLLLITE